MKIKASFNMQPESEPVSIYAAILPNKETQMPTLVLAKRGKYSTDTNNIDALLVDNPNVNGYTTLWDKDNFAESLDAYNTMKASGKIVIQESLQEFNIENVMQVARTRGNGQTDYEISSLQNGHVAILACCLFMHKQESFEVSMDMFGEIGSYISI